MEYIALGSITLAFVMTAILMVCHYLSPLIVKIPGLDKRKITSFAGGVAVSYVFLHMLPELVEGNEAIGEILKNDVPLSPILDLGIFIVALFGFNLYYGLEQLARKASAEPSGSSRKVYRLHLVMYCFYNFLITYTMPLRVQTGLLYSIIFTIAMGLHFTMMDRNFNRHFSRQFSATGRKILVLSLLLGWFITAVTEPINVLVVSLMIAFLSGSILYNVFREELPLEKTSYPAFTLGLIVTAVLLIFPLVLVAE
ncbi:MAG: hypothetical protein ISS61_00430 [Desulfobacteraceae bacterium]|nr:hypothetical protein [Desulfobacteraceae bacterium]